MEPDSPQATPGGFDWSGLSLFVATIFGAVLSFIIVRPFLPGIVGAVVLAIVTQRPHRWICGRLARPTLAATASLLLVALSIVVPTVVVVTSLGQRIVHTVRVVRNGEAGNSFKEFLTEHQKVAAAVNYAEENFDLGEQLEKSAGAVAGQAAKVVGKSLYAIIQIIVMLFILFFLYRDKDHAVSYLRTLLPLEPEETDFLLQRIRSGIHALVLGRFMVAGAQGLVAGVTYAAVGVSGAVLLGVATMLVALVPAVGAWVVWMPIVIFLMLSHQWVQALILLGVGALVISTMDNVLYPILVGSQLKLHTVPIFLSMLGGVVLFGVAGLILGPITFTTTASMVLIWRKRVLGEPLPPPLEA